MSTKRQRDINGIDEETTTNTNLNDSLNYHEPQFGINPTPNEQLQVGPSESSHLLNSVNQTNEGLTYQNRIATVSNLLQSVTITLPNHSDLANLTLLVFPLFLAFELWVFHTDPKRYTKVVESTEKKLKEILKDQSDKSRGIPVDEFVRERIEPLFHYTTQDLPNSELLSSPPLKRRKVQYINHKSKESHIRENSYFTKFLELPVELQLQVISFVGSECWYNCVRVNKDFRSMFLESRTHVDFSKYSMSESDFQNVLKKCPNLRSIRIPKMTVGDLTLQFIPRKVSSLKIGNIIGIDLNGLSNIESLPLEKLHVSGLEISEYILNRILLKGRKWKELRLCNLRVTSSGFISILSQLDLSDLTSLDISGLDLDRDDLKKLFNLPGLVKLEELNLSGNFLDKGLVEELSFKFGKILKVLNLSVCLIDHNDVKVICKAMPNLEVLELGYSRVNPSSSTMQHLIELKNLRRLQLRGWPIVVGHVSYLVSNLDLEELDIQYCGGVHKKNYDPAAMVQNSCTKILMTDPENLLENQLRDILDFAQRLQTLPLCRLFFPPFSRAQHREHFILAFRKTMQLIDLGPKKYLLSYTTPIPSSCSIIARSNPHINHNNINNNHNTKVLP